MSEIKTFFTDLIFFSAIGEYCIQLETDLLLPTILDNKNKAIEHFIEWCTLVYTNFRDFLKEAGIA